MKRYMLILCAVACTAKVYGEDSMEDADMQIMQNSTVIPKDAFEIIPIMSDMMANANDMTMGEKDNVMQQNQQDMEQNQQDMEQNQQDMEQNQQDMEQNQQDMEQNQEDMEQNQEDMEVEAPEEAEEGGAVSKLGFDFKPWSKNDIIPTLSQLNTMDNILAQNHPRPNLTRRDEKKPAAKPQKSKTTTTTPATLFNLNNQRKHTKGHDKKEREQTCKQVAIKVPATCYKDETLEMPYHCHKDVVKQECKMVTVEIPSTCQKTEYVEEQYPCQKARTVCKDVKKVCERIEYKEEEYVCGAPVCKQVKKQVPSTCTRKIKVKQPVPCPPPKKCKKVKMIDQSYPCGTRNVCKDVTVKAVCHRDVQVDEQYECLKEQTPRTPFAFNKLNLNQGDANELDEDDDSDVIRKENCAPVTIQVPSECTKSVVEKKPYSCVKTEHKQVCKNVSVRIPGVCTKSVQVDELYDCVEPQMDSPLESGRVCQEDSDSDEVDESMQSSDNMRKNRQLKHSKKSSCKKSCKVRKVTKEEPYKCEKTQLVKECNTVPVQVHTTCIEEKTVEKKYACRIPKTIERCERLYKRCTRQKTIQEPYDCEKTEKQCEAVPQTCSKKVPFEYEEDCDLKHHHKSDANMASDAEMAGGKGARKSHKSKAPQVCTETVDQDEEYECKKTIQVEECGKERVCKRRVAVPVAEECTENVCAQLMERQSCSRSVPVLKDYDCMKQDQVQQCEDKTHKVLSTCIKTITKPKPYMCTETQYQTICTSQKK